jgi:hypothetical protein
MRPPRRQSYLSPSQFLPTPRLYGIAATATPERRPHDNARVFAPSSFGIAVALLSRMPWSSGERLVARGASWRVAAVETHADCTALDLMAMTPPGGTKTLLLPFDRPRRAGIRRARLRHRDRRMVDAAEVARRRAVSAPFRRTRIGSS